MDTKQDKKNWFQALLDNSRFWVLSSGLICSLIVLGLVQQFVPSGILQTIRLEQIYGFISLTLLILALVVTPLTKVFPNIPGKEFYLHGRRAVGVLAFYYAALHGSISFFKQLEGFNGIKYLDKTYDYSLLAAVIALFILALMALTSFDWAIKKMTFKNWKRLHRFVYLAIVLIVFHVFLIGTHFKLHTIYYYLTILALIALIVLEVARTSAKHGQKS